MTGADVPAPKAKTEQEQSEEHDLRRLARALLAHALHVHATPIVQTEPGRVRPGRRIASPRRPRR